LKDLKDFYNELYSNLDAGSLFTSSRDWVKIAHLERLDAISAEIKSLFGFSRTFSLIDIGGAKGTFFHKLKSAGFSFRYVNTDISIVNLKKAKSAFIPNLVCCDAGNLPFRDAVFDVVLCSELLEHVINPKQVFAEAAKVTKGYAIFTTPTTGVSFLDKVLFDKRAKSYNNRIRSEMKRNGVKQTAEFLQNTTGAAHINSFTIRILMEMYLEYFSHVAIKGIFFAFPLITRISRLTRFMDVHRKIQGLILRHIPIFFCGFLGNQFSLLALKSKFHS